MTEIQGSVLLNYKQQEHVFKVKSSSNEKGLQKCMIHRFFDSADFSVT